MFSRKNLFNFTRKTTQNNLRVFDHVSDAIGNTPLIRLHGVTKRTDITVYAKLEYLNPGGSIKDRAAVSMIAEAEKSGLLLPGGTIIEATSGNTGIGLALVAASRHYHMIFVVPDKTSSEKINLLEAYGAQVHIVPSSLPAEHPDFIWNYAQRLAESIEGAWLASQYDNPANPAAHERGTGPEIWAQTRGKITHLIAGIGTGGTITGTARFLKSQAAVKVIGVDPAGSNYALGVPNATDQSREHAWHIEAIGHFRHPETEVDEWPECYDPEVLDGIEIVDDASAISALVDLARNEGILAGGSAGSALVAAARIAAQAESGAVLVVIVPDSGRSYLSKYFSPEWRNHWGFHSSQGIWPVDAISLPAQVAAHRTVRSVLCMESTPSDGAHLHDKALPQRNALSQLELSSQYELSDEIVSEIGDEIILITLRGGPHFAAAEIIGYIYRRDVQFLDGDDPIAKHARPVALVGVSENLAEREIDPEALLIYVDQGFAVAAARPIIESARASHTVGKEYGEREHERIS